jgi:hypothetical protein
MERPNLLLIRGARIIQQLNEASTYQDLENKTLAFIPPSRKRQHAVDPIQITQMKLVPYRNSGALQVEGLAQSDGKKYDTIMLFSDVVYEDGDQGDNVTFKGSDNQEYHIQPIQLSRNNVKVRCSCLDFRWRFALWNSKDGSLYGDPPGPYKKKTNRPPVNPQRVPALCKHLMKTTIALKQSGVLTP